MTKKSKCGSEETSAIVSLSPGCKNRCIFCLNTYTDDLPTSDFHKQKISVAKRVKQYRAEGYSNISISGNDPIEYQDIVSFVKYLRDIGFKTILFNTHGRASIETLRGLVDAGVSVFRIPLYGSTREVHESVTQARGSFDDVKVTIDWIHKHRISLNILTVLTQMNKHDLRRIFEMANTFNIFNFSFDTAYMYPKVLDHSYYIPYKDVGKFLRPIFEDERYAKYSFSFSDIPYCVFGTFTTKVIMPKNFDILKKYKAKAAICEACSLSSQCDGFYKNDIDQFGTGDLRPIQ